MKELAIKQHNTILPPILLSFSQTIRKVDLYQVQYYTIHIY